MLEEALRLSEMRFRRLLELSSVWYWEQDEEFRFVDIGAGPAEAALPDAYIGQTRWENDSCDLTEEEWAAHRVVLEAHQPFHDFEYSRLSRDGSRRYLATSGEPIPHHIDLFAMVTDWVERGVAPPDAPVLRAMSAAPPFSVSATKPMCRYPLYPRYRGSGDAKQAASYVCTAS